MARKKKEAIQEELEGSKVFDHVGDVPAGVDGLAGTAPTPITEGKAPADTVTIRLDAEGRIDVASMRPKTTEKLRAAVSKSPDLFPSAAVSPDSVPDFMVALPHQLIASLEITMASRNVPPAVAQRIFSYTEEDHKILAGPTKVVLAEYLPMMGKHQNLAALIGALFVVHSQKIAALRSYLENMQNAPSTPAQAA